MAQLLKVDGTTHEIEPKDPKKGFLLQECYELLECDTIEVVYIKHPYILIIDEEGKFKDPCYVNRVATARAERYISENDFIAGHAIYCRSSELK